MRVWVGNLEYPCPLGCHVLPTFPLSSSLSSHNASSKYDFVKVSISIRNFFLYSLFLCFLFLFLKVWLGDNADHYYALSGFLLSIMLTVAKVSDNHCFCWILFMFLKFKLLEMIGSFIDWIGVDFVKTSRDVLSDHLLLEFKI